MRIIIVVPEITARLSYTFDWIFAQQFGIEYSLCTEIETEQDSLFTINYTNSLSSFSIPNVGLLSENGISPREVNTGFWNELPTLFASAENNYAFPFDLFSAVFYLMSRYEEYLPFTPDKHQRYPATESILYKNNLLSRPIIDEWILAFEKILNSKGIKTKSKSFEFLPTYDIDIAWSYLNKGLKRSIGGCLRDVFKGDFAAVTERTAVLSGKKPDPFDSFDFIENCHQAVAPRPVYFFLSAEENTAYDKNTLPATTQMRQLMRKIALNNQVGIHPSYFSAEKPDLLGKEKSTLEEIIERRVTQSRQHYIRLKLPETYTLLIHNRIDEDYSMGYSTHFGFRAGTSRSFFWYDLQKEQETKLLIIPFCFMDATAHYELKLSAKESLRQLNSLKESLQKVNGKLTTIFHNFSLGSTKEWCGWAKAYKEFMQQMNLK
ncbi:MAG: polysaccharide deacetylase family protein [Bacteroidota bacterium]